MAKVSVIVPIYNVEKYLEKCLKSIVNQTLKDIEIILIDDGSTDDSLNIAKKIKQDDQRIVILEKENGGQSSARNMGMQIAKGEYIGFVDSDDWIDTDMYEKLYIDAKKYDADIAVCGRKIFDTEYKEGYKINFEKAIDKLNNIPDYILDKLLYKHTVSTCNKIYKRDILKNIIFEDVKLVGSEDALFNYCVLLNCKSIVQVEGTYYNGLASLGSTTRKYNSGCMKRTANLIEKMYFYSDKFGRRDIEKDVSMIFLIFFQQWNYNFIKNYGDENLRDILKKEQNLAIKNKYFKLAHKEILFNKKSNFYMKKMNYSTKGIIYMKSYFFASYLNLQGIASNIRAAI